MSLKPWKGRRQGDPVYEVRISEVHCYAVFTHTNTEVLECVSGCRMHKEKCISTTGCYICCHWVTNERPQERHDVSEWINSAGPPHYTTCEL